MCPSVSPHRCRPPPCASPSVWAVRWCSAASSPPRFTLFCSSPRKMWPHSESQPTASVPRCLPLPPLPAPATLKVQVSTVSGTRPPVWRILKFYTSFNETGLQRERMKVNKIKKVFSAFFFFVWFCISVEKQLKSNHYVSSHVGWEPALSKA